MKLLLFLDLRSQLLRFLSIFTKKQNTTRAKENRRIDIRLGWEVNLQIFVSSSRHGACMAACIHISDIWRCL
jgi:hypothetical protein